MNQPNTETTSNSSSYQREVTRLCIHSALLLLQHGAESTLVEQLSYRLGMALGMESVEIAISANAIVLSTISHDNCITSTRRNSDRGINMQVVTDIQHIVIMAERHLLNANDVKRKFASIKVSRYPRAMVIFIVACSCGCFSKLSGGGWDAFMVTFFASGFSMLIRLLLAAKRMNPLINFGITAFFATSISGLLLRTPLFIQASNVAMAASVLHLVPGFPLINAVSDMFKGYINTGLARWVMASLLTLFICLGVVAAMAFWGLQGWS